MTEDIISFPCLEVRQPIGVFYIGVIGSKDLISISYADIRRPEGRDIERYIGTQRNLSEGRVSEIKQYVTNIDASFPTSIIIAVGSEYAEYDDKDKILRIVKDEQIAKIIDGQHRIAGLEGYEKDDFQLNVTVFIDMDIEDQAMVFATINLKQTKVSKSLAYDLYEYASSRSPQKTCHNIVKLLNARVDSPFYRRIKILGKATGIGSELITQATFVDRLLKLISRDPMGDRDNIKRGRVLESYGRKCDSFVFRDRFIEEKDAEIAKIVWNYFKAVEEKWPSAWSDFDRGMILARTTGFAALVRVLPEIINAMQVPGGIYSREEFLAFLQKSTIKDKELTSDNFKPGSTGEAELVRRLRTDIFKTE